MSELICGLNNIGNTCFMNSALQLLVNCNVLTKFILNTEFSSKKINIYKKFLENYKNNDITTPDQVKLMISLENAIFRGTRQHDSHEFLIYLIDLLNDEFKSEFENSNILVANVDAKDLINNLFNNKITNIIYSDQTEEKVKNRFAEKILSLPINNHCYDLDDCLNLFQKIDELSGENKWESEKTKEKVEALKKLQIRKFSKYVIIHLKRFDNMNNKNGKSIKFKELTNLNNNKYELRAVIKHMGGTRGGHYICAVKKKNKWLLANDSSISDVNINNFLEDGYIYLYSKIKN